MENLQLIDKNSSVSKLVQFKKPSSLTHSVTSSNRMIYREENLLKKLIWYNLHFRLEKNSKNFRKS